MHRSIFQVALLLWAALWLSPSAAPAQQAAAQQPVAQQPMAQQPMDLPSSDPAAGLSQESLQRLAAEAANQADARPLSPDPASVQRGSINFLNLLIEGGVLMIPIAVMSLLVVAVSIERAFAIRRARVFPRAVRRGVQQARTDVDSMPPPKLYEVARQNPSAAARILQDMLQKVGRPVPEIEATIGEATQREAETLFGNVRWLTLAAAVTPLIGLLGTVWGMIIAFYNTTQLGAGSNKAEFLAEGIYVALVTTLGGLAVAIPAAIFAHYFEGKITRLLTQIDAEFRRLVPSFESAEGRVRYDLGPNGLSPRASGEPYEPMEQMDAETDVSSPPKLAGRVGKQRV